MLKNFNGIAKTSLLVAAMRAKESERTDSDGRLFNDPYAKNLCGAYGFKILEEAIKVAGDQPAVPIRTFYFDQQTLDAIKNNISQIVILASGMDTRAYRLNLSPTVKLFEMDRKEVIEYKKEILKDEKVTCSHIQLCNDLTKDEWDNVLIQNGFDKDKPTLFIVEGLVMYLKENEVMDIFSKIKKLAFKDSILLCDVLSKTLLEAPFMKAQLDFLKSLGAPWLFGTNDPEIYFKDFGWLVTATSAGEVMPSRWPFPVPPRHVPNVPRGFFLKGIFN